MVGVCCFMAVSFMKLTSCKKQKSSLYKYIFSLIFLLPNISPVCFLCCICTSNVFDLFDCISILNLLTLSMFVYLKERRDFAMREIIYDLLCVGKPTKIFAPEVNREAARLACNILAVLIVQAMNYSKLLLT